MHTVRIIRVSVFAILVSLSLFSTANAERELRVAVVLGLTGSASIHAAAIRAGVELAADELSGKGWKLEIRWDDDQTDPKKTVSSMQFARAQGYTFFIGPTWSFQANAARSVIERGKLIALVPAGSSEINGGPIAGVFNFTPSRKNQVEPIRQWSQEKGLKRACILTPNGDWGDVHRRAFRAGVESVSAEVVYEEQFEYGAEQTVLKSLLMRGKQKRCDSLLITSGPSEVALIVKGRNELGLKFPVLATHDLYDAVDSGLLTRSDIAEGVYVVSVTVGEDFRARYAKKFQQPPKLYADRGFDALMVLAEAVEATDGSRDAVNEYLKQTLDREGASGRMKFDANGDVKDRAYVITKASEGMY